MRCFLLPIAFWLLEKVMVIAWRIDPKRVLKRRKSKGREKAEKCKSYQWVCCFKFIFWFLCPGVSIYFLHHATIRVFYLACVLWLLHQTGFCLHGHQQEQVISFQKASAKKKSCTSKSNYQNGKQNGWYSCIDS